MNPAPRRTGRRLGSAGPAAGVSVAVAGIWYAVSYLLLDPDRRFLLPPPHAVARVAFGNRDNLRELLAALLRSTEVAMVGLGVAIAAGVAAAVLMSQARWIERGLYPYFVVLQAVPILALVPLLGFWFGYGMPCRILVCVLVAIFPIVANTLFGIQSVDAAHDDLFTLHRANRVTRMRKLQLPTALPAMFTGLRISAGLSVIGAIVGDFFFRQGPPGIGVLIDVYRQRLAPEQMFGAVILSSALGVSVFWLFGFLTRRVVGGWHESARDRFGESQGGA